MAEPTRALKPAGFQALGAINHSTTPPLGTIRREIVPYFAREAGLWVAHSSRVLVIASRDHELFRIFGERRLLACSWRQPAANIPCTGHFRIEVAECGLGKLPRPAGWQPALPQHPLLADGRVIA